MQKVEIIGVGRVGGALALALPKEKYLIDKLVSRSLEKSEHIAEHINPKPIIKTLDEIKYISAKIIFITTQDSEIEKVAKRLANIDKNEKTFVFHMSGSLSSEVLQTLNKNDYKTGSIHPLVSISDSFMGVQRFKGAYFCVEGDEESVKIANEIVEDLGGKSFSIDTKYKTLYHASAVTACGHLVSLLDTATEMLRCCGVEKDEAKKILMPLVKSTVENLETQSFSDALTGTFARGDVDTMEKHIESLKDFGNKNQTKTYLELGEHSLSLAKEQGIDKEILEKMAKKISLAKKNFKC